MFRAEEQQSRNRIDRMARKEAASNSDRMAAGYLSRMSHLLKGLLLVVLRLAVLCASVIGIWTTGVPAVAAGAETRIDTKPKVFQFMAYNDKVDSYQDELRLDLVLRVPHKEFDPNCVALGQTTPAASRGCSLSFLYQYSGSDQPRRFRRSRYINTMGRKGANSYDGALAWARNQDEAFTVHEIINSGVYDYLAISIEGDLDYTDTKSSIDAYKTGGSKQELAVYAVIDHDRQGRNILCGDAVWNYGDDMCGTFNPDSLNSARSVNIMDAIGERGTRLYMQNCRTSGAAKYCSGPASFVGWDGHPLLWSGRQANWGLVTDFGFPAGNNNPAVPEGVAPAKSFFVYWYNVGGPGSSKNPGCTENTSFKYQWVGLKNNTWVPVKALTPKAVEVQGQPAGYSSPGSASGSEQGAAYNDKPRAAGSSRAKTNNLFAVNDAGEPMPAQRPDGSIDFKLAKSMQGLDGYFKLLTWPITKDANGQICKTTTQVEKDTYNPEAGIENLDAKEVEHRMQTAWTIDTAFYRYSVNPPQAPTINSIDGTGLGSGGAVWADSLTPTISGTCQPAVDPQTPNRVTLFGENPAKPISANNPDESDNRGFAIGTVACVPNDARNPDKGGTWSIRDDNTAYPSKGVNTNMGRRRYHAWITEHSTGYNLTSGFSNLATARFAAQHEAAPVVQAITVPHTRKGVLPAGSAVRVEGTARPTYLAGNDTNLSDSRLEVFMVQSSSRAETSLGTSGEHDFSTSTPSGGSSPVGHIVIEPVTEGHVWHWKIDINPLVFLNAFDGSPGSEKYTFGARLVNPAGKPSDDARKDQMVDMTPTDPGIIGADWQTVSGRAVMKGTETVDANAKVTVTWPSDPAGRTSDTVMSGADGAWAVLLPSGIEPGEVSVTVVDSNGNQSEPYKQYLDVAPPLDGLPLAGAPKHMTLLLVFSLVLLVALTCAWLRRRREFTPPAS